MLNPSAEVMELEPGGIDLAVRYKDRRRLQKEVTAVLISDMVVIGTPSLVGDQAHSAPAALMKLPWLQELGTNEVAEWFEHRDVTLNRPLMISKCRGT